MPGGLRHWSVEVVQPVVLGSRCCTSTAGGRMIAIMIIALVIVLIAWIGVHK
jgi:hypothetical protein